MNQPSSAFTPAEKVKELVQATRPWQAAEHYGFHWPDRRTEGNIRVPCPFDEGCKSTGLGTISLNANHPDSIFQCFSCQTRGDLLKLMFGMKHQRPASGPDGQLSRDEYREMVADLLHWHGEADNDSTPSTASHRPAGDAPPPSTPLSVVNPNTALRRSSEPRIQALADLPQQGTLDESAMRPAAAKYRRERPYLTEEMCQKWSIFYLPPSSKSTLRGRWAYQINSPQGDALAFAGRDPEFDLKLAEWKRQGEPDGGWMYRKSRQRGAPTKTRFPSTEYFRKYLELYGQQVSRLSEPTAQESLDKYGLIVTPGLNAVVRLDQAGVIAVSSMAATIAMQQRQKLLDWSAKLCRGRVTVWDTADAAGQRRSKEALAMLAPHTPVLQAWSPETHDGEFQGRSPDELSNEDLALVLASLEARWQRS